MLSTLNKTGLVGAFKCNNVPGHSGCKARIENGDCPSAHGDVTPRACHGHSHNPEANMPKALEWIDGHNDKMRRISLVDCSNFFVTKVHP